MTGATVPSLHALANPARFLRIARPLTPVLTLTGIALIAIGCWAGLTRTPADYLQGETVRILYIHVPAAWLGMGGWTGLAIASAAFLIWRHPLAQVAARAIALPGAVFVAICLVTGSIWGRPTWGTWWQWDGRLTSMLLLFFVYCGYMALLIETGQITASDCVPIYPDLPLASEGASTEGRSSQSPRGA